MNAADTSAWQGASSLRVTSSRVRCGSLVLLPLQMRETLGAQPRRLIAATNRPMRVMLDLQPRRSRAAKIAGKSARPLARAAESKPRRQLRLQYRCSFPPVCRGLNRFSTPQAGRRGFSRHDACSFGRAAAIKSPARAIARAGESAGPVAGPTSPSSISPRRFEKPLSSRRVWARTGNRSSPPCRAA